MESADIEPSTVFSAKAAQQHNCNLSTDDPTSNLINFTQDLGGKFYSCNIQSVQIFFISALTTQISETKEFASGKWIMVPSFPFKKL